MVEKKFCVDQLRVGYSGPFSIVDYYAFIDRWAADHGLGKELKKKSERVFPGGKKIEWTVELWKNPADYVKQVVRLRSLFSDVKIVSLQEKRVQHGDCLFVIDGILETDIKYRWEQAPLYTFMRTLSDKLFKKTWLGHYEPELTQLSYALERDVRKFFGQYVHMKK